MPRRKDKKATGVEYCRGYVDEHGQWNNGFYCPQWGDPGRGYCCGKNTHRFCCPQETTPPNNGLTEERLPVMLGAVVGCLLVAMVTLILTCYFCRCCWLYRRRKRLRHDGTPNITGGPVDYAVNYTVCPHSTYLREGGASCYPMDDPPPYPGEPSSVPEEKQPLNPTQLCVAIDGPEDATNPVTFSLNRRCSPPAIEVPSCSTASSGMGDNSRVQNHRDYSRHAPRHPPHHCYQDRVTIFSNIGALNGDTTRRISEGCSSGSASIGGRTPLPIPKEVQLRFHSKDDRSLLLSRGSRDDISTSCEQLQEMQEQLASLPSTSSAGHYNTDMDDFVTSVNNFTALSKSQTFSLEERGDIELTTFRGATSPIFTAAAEQQAAEKRARRSIELGSFFRSPLGGDPADCSFVRRPNTAAGASETVRSPCSLVYPSYLQNGDAHALRLSPEILNNDEDDLTDLTIQVIPQG